LIHVEHQIEELAELHDIIENGPNWYALDRIEIHLADPSYRTTLDNADECLSQREREREAVVLRVLASGVRRVSSPRPPSATPITSAKCGKTIPVSDKSHHAAAPLTLRGKARSSMALWKRFRGMAIR
jgi:hypothetical protein